LVEARREEGAAAVEGVVVPVSVLVPVPVVPVPVVLEPVPVVPVPVPVDKVLAGVGTDSSELVVEVSVVSVLVPVADTVLEEEPELKTVAPIVKGALMA